jgi:LacI family transcriptional regulator
LPSLRQIAALAEVHYSTVSLALRGHASIPAETRARIFKIAKELGYQRDPMLSALAHYRHLKKARMQPATLAFLTPRRSARNWWDTHHTGTGYYEGALQRAQELGFGVETFSYHRAEMSPLRLDGVLRTRNIHSLLLFPTIQSRGHLRLPWERYNAVTIGYSLVYPPIHRVATAHTQSIMTLLRHLRSLGYRRFGLVLQAEHDERVNHAWSAGYILELQRLPRQSRIPMLSTLEEKLFLRWLKRWKPDVVVSPYSQPMDWLREAKWQIPEQIGFASLSLSDPLLRKGISGIDENSAFIGASAIDLLVAQLQRLERGIPEKRMTLLIEGNLSPGRTVSSRLKVD